MNKKRATAAAAASVVNAEAAPPATLGRLLASAIDHLRNERIDQAEPLLQEILQHAPEHVDALHYLGVLRHTQGRTLEAVTLIHRSLALLPDNATAWNNLGNVLLLAGRAEEAAQAYEKAVGTSGTSGATGSEAPLALNNLAILYRKLGRLGDSESASRRAIALAADFGDAWHTLSSTLIKQGRINEGLLAHSKAVALWPEHLQSRQEMTRALLMLGEYERASKLLREWLDSDPGNPVALHMLAACKGSATPERASDQYVEQVFDGFAASFDAKLEALHYRAPALVTQALAAVVGAPTAALDIVDAGCGTGLCGPGLRPFARQLVGCDLSVGMLRRAKSRHDYDVLHKAELTHYLATQPAAYDAVVSADTLCYFGALDTALLAAHRCLRPDGWLVFTVEALPDGHAEPHQLQANGRYAHEQGYLRRALAEAAFEVTSMQRETLRLEAGDPVNGWLVTARRPALRGDLRA